MWIIILFSALFALAGCTATPGQAPTATSVQDESSPTIQLLPTETDLPIVTPSEAAAPDLPRFEPSECQFSPPYISYIECGYLIVPEERSRPDGPSIRLHVAVARSVGKEPAPDPLIYLSGGPGSRSLQWLYGNIHNYLDILKTRDVIFFDPRGVGYSEPSLDCPEVMEAFHETRAMAITSEDWVDRQVEASLVCRERLLQDGIDLTAYHSGAMAADVSDLRKGLGYEKVNLFGISYGTRTAQTVMRDYPEIVRSVVLDSVVPIEADLFGSDALNADQALAIIIERCQVDPPCHEAFPDLLGTLEKVSSELAANPLTIRVRHLLTNQMHDVNVDQSVFGGSLVEALYNYETAVYLPKLIYDTYYGDEDSYSTLATSLEIYLLYGDFSSEGMRNSVLCSDEGSFVMREEALEKIENIDPALADYFKKDLDMTFQICEQWGAYVSDQIENQPIASAIPTLVMSGEYDPVTPPAWGKAVAGNLENAQFIEFPGLGHFAFADRRCPRDIVAEFLNDPETPPDSTCAEKIQFHFVTR